MKVALVILNLLAALAVLLAMPVIHQLTVLDVSVAYTALDRAQVIDRAKLKEAFPDLADNDRHEFAVWACEGENHRILGVACVAGFVLNAGLIAVFWKKGSDERSLAEPSAPADGEDAAAEP